MKGIAAVIALGTLLSLVGCSQEAAPAAGAGTAPAVTETAKPGAGAQAGAMEAQPLMGNAEAEARVGSQSTK